MNRKQYYKRAAYQRARSYNGSLYSSLQSHSDKFHYIAEKYYELRHNDFRLDFNDSDAMCFAFGITIGLVQNKLKKTK